MKASKTQTWLNERHSQFCHCFLFCSMAYVQNDIKQEQKRKMYIEGHSCITFPSKFQRRLAYSGRMDMHQWSHQLSVS